MFDIKTVKKQFGEKCTACGLCVEFCPIVQYTELKGVDPEKIMMEILDLFNNKKIGNLARTRIYSCLYCNTCVAHCPQRLQPGLAYGIGKAVLHELGDKVPETVLSFLPMCETLIGMMLPAFQEGPELPDWLVTDLGNKKPEPCKTVLFSSCFGLIQKDALITTVKLLHRIDPHIKVLGGFNYCCGELQFIAGKPEEAEVQFGKAIKGLNSFSPEKVLMFCPSCNMNFDRNNPDVTWSWTLITDFIAEHVNELGTLHEVNATVTVHDPCHFVRGIKSNSDSPRKILRAIPGIKIIEMANTQENALCCGAYAITGMGAPGESFRNQRMKQAKDTGADILSLYCPGCHMILGSEGPGLSLRVESILTLLAESLRIK